MPRIHNAEQDLANLTLEELRLKYLDKLVRYKRRSYTGELGSWSLPQFVVEINYHWNNPNRIFIALRDEPHAPSEPRPMEGNWLDRRGWIFQIAGED